MSANMNTTTNGTQPLIKSCISNPTAANIGQTFAYCLIFAVSMAGNILIGIIVYKTKTMRKPINFLIVNMALSDLLFPIFLIPRELTELYVDSYYPWQISGSLGQALCKLVFFFREISLSVSIQSLVLIAVDRFGAVVFPLRPPLMKSKLCPFFILATWIVAMAIWSPLLFASTVKEYPEGMRCERQWHEVFGEYSSYKNYMLALLVVGIYIPLVLIAILYIIIYLKLKSPTILGEQSANARQQRANRERNVLKMAIAIVVGFAVCWLPLSMSWMLDFFVSNIWSHCSFEYYSLVANFMFYANCAINPCICFLFSENYRQGLRHLIRCS
ncbi:QRFP-like peptide receptor [Oculina patagonica]